MIRTLVLATTLLAVTACDRSFVDADSFAGFGGDSNVRGRMAGAMPVTGDFDRDLRTGYVWRAPGSVDFDLHVLGDEGWVMIGGGFDPAVLSEGETVTLEPDEHWVFGCSGPDEWNAEFDEPAEEVSVSKETIEVDGVEMAEVTITAVFPGSGDVTAVVVKPTNPDNNDD